MALNLTITGKTQIQPNVWRIDFDNNGKVFVLRRLLTNTTRWIIGLPQADKITAPQWEQMARDFAGMSWILTQFSGKEIATQWSTHEMTLYHYFIVTDQEKDAFINS